MKFQYIIAILGLFLFSCPARAMDDEYEFGKVIVKLWQPTDYIPLGHAAFTTDEGYISLGLRGEILTQQKTSFPAALAYDLTQDERELGEPDETYVLRLKTEPMNAVWRKLKGGYAASFMIERALKNVKYCADTINITSEDAPEIKSLYFNAMILAKGLLYAGGITKIPQKIAYFRGCKGLPGSRGLHSSFDDVINNNWEIIKKPVPINEIREMIKEAIKCQNLLIVEKKISAMQMTYLTTTHKQEIVNHVFRRDKTLANIQSHLLELHQAHEKYKRNYWPSGYWNYWVIREWKD